MPHTVFIEEDGTMRGIASPVTRDLRLGDRRRVSHVEPVRPVLRWLFHKIRRRVDDESRWARFTRRWPCRWQADIFDGPTLGPFNRRSDAIDAEIDYINRNLEGPAMVYDSIIVQAYWFQEGQFWNVQATGYITRDGDDEPVSLETDPPSFGDPEDDITSVLKQLELLAGLFTDQARIVPIHLNGNEIKTLEGIQDNGESESETKNGKEVR